MPVTINQSAVWNDPLHDCPEYLLSYAMEPKEHEIPQLQEENRQLFVLLSPVVDIIGLIQDTRLEVAELYIKAF